jgi:hypothetical protein
MKNLLAKLNGNKSIICLALSTVLAKMIEFNLLEKSNVTDFINWGLIALATGAIAHHVQKGYLSSDKGN